MRPQGSSQQPEPDGGGRWLLQGPLLVCGQLFGVRKTCCLAGFAPSDSWYEGLWEGTCVVAIWRWEQVRLLCPDPHLGIWGWRFWQDGSLHGTSCGWGLGKEIYLLFVLLREQQGPQAQGMWAFLQICGQCCQVLCRGPGKFWQFLNSVKCEWGWDLYSWPGFNVRFSEAIDVGAQSALLQKPSPSRATF